MYGIVDGIECKTKDEYIGLARRNGKFYLNPDDILKEVVHEKSAFVWDIEKYKYCLYDEEFEILKAHEELRRAIWKARSSLIDRLLEGRIKLTRSILELLLDEEVESKIQQFGFEDYHTIAICRHKEDCLRSFDRIQNGTSTEKDVKDVCVLTSLVDKVGMTNELMLMTDGNVRCYIYDDN